MGQHKAPAQKLTLGHCTMTPENMTHTASYPNHLFKTGIGLQTGINSELAFRVASVPQLKDPPSYSKPNKPSKKNWVMGCRGGGGNKIVLNQAINWATINIGEYEEVVITNPNDEILNSKLE